jgi:hypothetical protein
MKIYRSLTIDSDTLAIIAEDSYEYDGSIWLADKKAQSAARGAEKTTAGTATGYGSAATGVGSTLVPELTKEATNPTGINPTDLNAMRVGSAQGAGGAAGSLANEGVLSAARSRNTGSLAGTLGEIARSKTRAASEGELGIQSMNAKLKEQQRQAGLKGLESVYGTDVAAQLKAEGLVPEDINAMVNAGKSGWLQNTLDVMNTLEGGAGVAEKYLHHG